MLAFVVVAALGGATPTPSAPLGSSAPDILVMTPLGDDTDLTRGLLAQSLTSALDGRDGKSAVSLVDLQGLIEAEGNRQRGPDCDVDATSCLAELGAALGARFIVSSRVVRLGETLVWQVSYLDVAAARAIGRAEVNANDIAGLRANAGDIAKTLVPVAFPTFTQAALLGVGGGVFVVGATGAVLFGLQTAQISDTLDSQTASLDDKQQAFDQAAYVPRVFVGAAGVAVVGVAACIGALVIE
jgi:hypothetical protein